MRAAKEITPLQRRWLMSAGVLVAVALPEALGRCLRSGVQ